MRFVVTLGSGVIALCLMTAASDSTELPPLVDDPRIQHEFLSASVGAAIRKNCPTVSIRMFRVWVRLNELKGYALSLGYTRDDFDRLRRSPEAKALLEGRRDTYLEKHGVAEGDVESYCRLGLAEIEKNSLTGWILRAN